MLIFTGSLVTLSFFHLHKCWDHFDRFNTWGQWEVQKQTWKVFSWFWSKSAENGLFVLAVADFCALGFVLLALQFIVYADSHKCVGWKCQAWRWGKSGVLLKLVHCSTHLPCLFSVNLCSLWLIHDGLYSAVFHSLEQTHCAHMWFYMSD